MIPVLGTDSFTGLMEDPSSPQFKLIHGDATLSMGGVTALEITDSSQFRMTPLFRRQKDVWLKKGVLVRDSADVVFNPAEGDMRGLTPAENGFTTMMALQRFKGKKDQRIIVGADADCLSNFNIMQVDKFGSYLYSWATYGNFPIYFSFPETPDRLLTINGTTAKVLGIVYMYIMPGIVLLLAAILLIRRKRK